MQASSSALSRELALPPSIDVPPIEFEGERAAHLYRIRSETGTQPVFGPGVERHGIDAHRIAVHEHFDNFDPKRPTFVLAMGRGQGSESYSHRMVRELKTWANVVVYDQPYQGRSTPDPVEGQKRLGDIENMRDAALHMRNVILHIKEKYGVDKVVIGGHSFGGFTAKDMASLPDAAEHVSHAIPMAAMYRPYARTEHAAEFNYALPSSVMVPHFAVRAVRGQAVEPAGDEGRGWDVRSQKPAAQTRFAEFTAGSYAIERQHEFLRTEDPTVRWILGAMSRGALAAFFRPKVRTLHVVGGNEVISNRTTMRNAARLYGHPFVTVGGDNRPDGQLHDTLRYSDQELRAVSDLIRQFVEKAEQMSGRQRLGQAEPSKLPRWQEVIGSTGAALRLGSYFVNPLEAIPQWFEFRMAKRVQEASRDRLADIRAGRPPEY